MQEITDRLRALKRGERFVYHIGSLLVDAKTNTDLQLVRALTQWLWAKKRVHLFQRRLPKVRYMEVSDGEGLNKKLAVYDYAYIAVGR